MGLVHSGPNHILHAFSPPGSWVLTFGWSDPWPRRAGGRWEKTCSSCFREAGECLGWVSWLGVGGKSMVPGLPRVKPTLRKKKKPANTQGGSEPKLYRD